MDLNLRAFFAQTPPGSPGKTYLAPKPEPGNEGRLRSNTTIGPNGVIRLGDNQFIINGRLVDFKKPICLGITTSQDTANTLPCPSLMQTGQNVNFIQLPTQSLDAISIKTAGA